MCESNNGGGSGDERETVVVKMEFSYGMMMKRKDNDGKKHESGYWVGDERFFSKKKKTNLNIDRSQMLNNN